MASARSSALAVCAIALLAAASVPAAFAAMPPVIKDGATIVNSGSTNFLGYAIEVWSDGSASAVTQSRLGARGAPHAFTISPAQARAFFADLRAARDGHAVGEHCMKSASFGTTTHVTWHGWTSPDLDCPPAGGLTAALVHDVGVIRQASPIVPSMLRAGSPGLRRLSPPGLSSPSPPTGQAPSRR